ncbi:MAG: trypsin-like serine protease [Gemmatimonadaceae bacterium]|jgi:hypothetical protein|nr:trypsin-like serine protease [Gemmatimonadaceae bacterium]
MQKQFVVGLTVLTALASVAEAQRVGQARRLWQRVDDAGVAPTLTQPQTPPPTASTINAPTNNALANHVFTIPGQGTFRCSGTLLSSQRHILTAAHCVDGATLSSFQVRFGPDRLAPSFTRTASNVFVRQGYTGAVIEGRDIAIIELNQAVNIADARGFDIFTGDAVGQTTELTGFGCQGTLAGGATNCAATSRRYGFNRNDFRGTTAGAGNTAFQNYWSNTFAGENPVAAREGILWQDNDFTTNTTSRTITDWAGANRTVANQHDASCYIQASFCNTGLGLDESGVAGGDSGGGGFIGGLLASVNSFGSWAQPPGNPGLGPDLPDNNPFLDSSYGEYSGVVDVAFHAAWIRGIVGPTVVIPEPSTYALIATGLAGIAFMRRRRSAK